MADVPAIFAHVTPGSVEALVLARQNVRQHRLALARIERALVELRRGRVPNLAGITFDVEFVDEDGNEVDGPVELDAEGWRVLLEAERETVRDDIARWNQTVGLWTPTNTQLRSKCPGEVRHRSAPRPRERREQRRTRRRSASSSDDPSEPGEPPGIARLGRAFRAARRRVA